jgi:hypothetical protein
MKHDVLKTPLAMRVFGFINTSPILQRNSAPNDCTVPIGTEPLPRGSCATKDLSDAAWRLNEYHMQIECILRESGFLELQQTGLKWNLNFRGKFFRPSFTLTFHSKSETLKVTMAFVDTSSHALPELHSSVEHVSAQPCYLDTQRPAVFPIANPTSSTSKLVRDQNISALKAMSQQYLKNAFGLNSDRGIFGGCPGKILHLILIGWFKFERTVTKPISTIHFCRTSTNA